MFDQNITKCVCKVHFHIVKGLLLRTQLWIFKINRNSDYEVSNTQIMRSELISSTIDNNQKTVLEIT